LPAQHPDRSVWVRACVVGVLGVVGGSGHNAVVAYDVELADRIRMMLKDEPGLTERRMFGGLAFLIDGNMAVSASSKGGLLLRVDPALTGSLVSEPEVGRFEMRGREMDGWLRVDASVVEGDGDLQHWVSHGVTYARSLVSRRRGAGPASRA
jgi:hypothetical protein